MRPVHILYAAIPPEPFPLTLPDRYQTLPKRFLDEAKLFHRPQDYHARLLGRLLLQQGLEQLGFPKRLSETLQHDPSGRPFVAGPVDFNISHSGSLVVCAITTRGRIGIDIEMVTSLDLSDFMSFLTPQEWDEIHNDLSPSAMFFRCWTHRECVLKAEGSGLAGSLTYLSKNPRLAVVEGKFWHVTEIFSWEGYACSLATESSHPPIEIAELN